MNTLGTKIYKARKSNKYTLDKMAKITGVSKSYLWELENEDSKRKPSAEKLKSIAEALNLELNFLLEDDTREQGEKEIDEVFFRNYRTLEPSDKERLRDVLQAFRKS